MLRTIFFFKPLDSLTIIYSSLKATGEGQMLLASPTMTQPISPAAPENLSAPEERTSGDLNLDENEPTTNVRILLDDGSLLMGHFNHTHTVGQMRQYIET